MSTELASMRQDHIKRNAENGPSDVVRGRAAAAADSQRLILTTNTSGIVGRLLLGAQTFSSFSNLLRCAVSCRPQALKVRMRM